MEDILKGLLQRDSCGQKKFENVAGVGTPTPIGIKLS